MPTKYRALQQQIENHLGRRKVRNDSLKTLEGCKYVLNRWAKGLKDAGLELNPKKMGEREVLIVFNIFPGAPVYQFWALSFVNVFLKKEGNPIVDTLDLVKPQSSRNNVSWLDDDEEQMLWNYAKSDCSELERAVIMLELGSGLRRVEVMRLEAGKVLSSTFEVRGKGRRGGKVRTIQLSENVKQALNEWRIKRSEIISEAQKINPLVKVPLEMIIHNRTKRGCLNPYGETGLDEVVDRVRRGMEKKYGREFDFSNHTLRRTCGRRLWKQGVKIEVIQNILGHESPAMTYLYLGINLKDQDEAMNALDQYVKSLTPKNTAFLGEASEMDGLIRI